MHSCAPVIVMELPEELNHAQEKTFLPELRPLLEADRPRLVLECTHVRHIDIGGVEMLLHCLEETMKADGDLKLAAVSPAFEATLQRMHVDRLFEIFDTDKEAVQSFYASQPRAVAQGEPRYAAAYDGLEDSEAA
jgi:anti-anti-sigma factor